MIVKIHFPNSSMTSFAILNCLLVLEPIRQSGADSPNCLDSIMSSSPSNVSNVFVGRAIGKTDHSVITWDFHTYVNNTCEREIFRYGYSKADYVKLRIILRNIHWYCVIGSNDVNIAWCYFHEQINNAVKECVPVIKINKSKINPSWFNVSVKSCVRIKYFS